jgi:hypothetical protein
MRQKFLHYFVCWGISFIFSCDRVHLWDGTLLAVYIDCVNGHFELLAGRWIIKLWTISIFSFSFCCVRCFLLCAVILPSAGLLSLSLECIKLGVFLCTAVLFWLSGFVWELAVDSGDCCQPQILLWIGHLNFKTVTHIIIIPFILFWTWQELYFQNCCLNLQHFCNRGFRFFLLLALWLMLEGLEHVWNFSVVLLTALSAVWTLLKMYISIAVYWTTTAVSI